MEHFKLLTPTNIGEAFNLLDKYKNEKIQIVAGGTDLIPALRSKKLLLDYLLDISNLELDKIQQQDDCIKIGAMVTFNTIANNEMIQSRFPALVSAANQVGAIQTRTLATIGGNICSAVPSLDSAPVLLALDARLVLITKDSERTVPINEFFTGPRRTVLQANEILSEIIIPISKGKCGLDFTKFGRRKALTLSIINSAVCIELNDKGEISKARIALGAVAPTPVRAYKCEEELLGKIPSEELFEKVSLNVEKEINPITDLRASAEYRKHLSKVLVKRNFMNALQQIQD